MRKVLAIAFVLVVALAAGASAADVEGKVQSVSQSDRMFVLEDGTKIWLAEGMSIDQVKEGAKVKASYEERDGRNIATTLDVSE